MNIDRAIKRRNRTLATKKKTPMRRHVKIAEGPGWVMTYHTTKGRTTIDRV